MTTNKSKIEQLEEENSQLKKDLKNMKDHFALAFRNGQHAQKMQERLQKQFKEQLNYYDINIKSLNEQLQNCENTISSLTLIVKEYETTNQSLIQLLEEYKQKTRQDAIERVQNWLSNCPSTCDYSES